MSRRGGPAILAHEKEAKIKRQRERRLSGPPSTYRKIGATEADYQRFWKLQGGVCAICQKPSEGRRRLHLDHNHETGKLRGLLCYSCNYKLGFVEKFLHRIVRYLGGTLEWS